MPVEPRSILASLLHKWCDHLTAQSSNRPPVTGIAPAPHVLSILRTMAETIAGLTSETGLTLVVPRIQSLDASEQKPRAHMPPRKEYTKKSGIRQQERRRPIADRYRRGMHIVARRCLSPWRGAFPATSSRSARHRFAIPPRPDKGFPPALTQYFPGDGGTSPLRRSH